MIVHTFRVGEKTPLLLFEICNRDEPVGGNEPKQKNLESSDARGRDGAWVYVNFRFG